ncbi:MAG: alpha-galactosidase [Rhodothermales bacterium]
MSFSLKATVHSILRIFLVLSLFIFPQTVLGQSSTNTFPHEDQAPTNSTDWLIDARAYEAGVYKTANPNELTLSNGLISRTFRLSPNAATVRLSNHVTDESVIRGVKPEAVLMIDSVRYEIGGMKGQPNYAYLTDEWIDKLERDSMAFQFASIETGEPAARMAWKQSRHHAPDVSWPPKGQYLKMNYRAPEAAIHLRDVTVSIHYIMYDGIPAYSKWLTVHNASSASINIDAFTSEILAAVEEVSWVESRGVHMPTPNIHVETDYSFGGMRHENASRLSVHWNEDPDYATQVNYLRTTPTLLEVSPTYGPDQTVAAGAAFESFRAFVLIYDSTEKERKGLAQRKLYRTIAPWATENPIMMHVRFSDWESVKTAIDQAAEVGFEMVILTFGSGFDIENTSEAYRAEMKRYAAYAKSKEVELGGYSLLSSRRIEPDEDNSRNPETGEPGGQTHGFSPALASPWGQAYFANLYDFYQKSGFTLLEHDGSYPGDLDAAARPPLQKGVHDSRWVQWRIISDFYKWSLANGIYLNVPDWYFLVGSTKVAMGYRETNWSLPRAQQVIHTRQNIYDGTWGKAPSMGWMFVPLTEYHGGGEAATIEPLDEHLDHYEKMLSSNMALGVQSAYRGPRLYDTDRTRQVVVKWVDWYKQYRDILESDIIHGRRADGKDIDWMLHVNPNLEYKGMLVVFNPLNRTIDKTLNIPLYYSGLDQQATISHEAGTPFNIELERDYSINLQVSVPANGMTWYLIEE